LEDDREDRVGWAGGGINNVPSPERESRETQEDIHDIGGKVSRGERKVLN